MSGTIDFTGKQVFITGATAGIGKETAVTLSRLGAKLILLGHLEGELTDTMSILDGKGHHAVVYDLSDLAGIEPMIRELYAIRGPFDGFVHCVGIRSRRPLAMITPVIMREVINTNLGSFLELVRCISRKGNFNPGLSIVGISSISSQRGHKGVTIYAASKAGLEAAGRCLAKELATKGIRVNTVVPAQIDTPAYREFLKISGENDESPDLLSRQYLGLGQPSDVANVIAFLLGGSSRFITGSAIPVDGGFLSS